MIKKILVSQPRPQTGKSPYFDVAEKYGVEMNFRPLIRVSAMTPQDFRTQKVSILDHTAVVFSSRHCIDHFFNLCKELRVAVPDTMKYFCKSEQVALYIQKYVQYRKRKIFFTQTGRLDDIVPLMVKHKTEKYLVPQSSIHDDDFKNKLDAAKLHHTECVMYYTISNDLTAEELAEHDMFVFFSPEGIHALTNSCENFVQGDKAIACLGAKTVEEAEKMGLRVDMHLTPELRSVPAIIEDYIKRHQ